MADKKWCDWTDLMKGRVGQPEDPLSKPLGYIGPTLKKGEIPRKPSDEEIRKAVLSGAPKQPTDEQMFGHLVPTQKQINEVEDKWHNAFTKFFRTKHAPIEKQTLEKNIIGRGPISKEELTEEEKRILAIPVNPDAYKA